MSKTKSDKKADSSSTESVDDRIYLQRGFGLNILGGELGLESAATPLFVEGVLFAVQGAPDGTVDAAGRLVWNEQEKKCEKIFNSFAELAKIRNWDDETMNRFIERVKKIIG